MEKTTQYIKDNNIKIKKRLQISDKNGDRMVMTPGFKIAEDSPTLIKEGIVVEDELKNQYVWIPVFKRSENRKWGIDYSNVENEKDYENIKLALKQYTKTYAKNGYTDEWYGYEECGAMGYYEKDDSEKSNLIYYTNGNMNQEQYNNLYNQMISSIYVNDGFYIGRYEMGMQIAKTADEYKKGLRSEMKEYKSTSNNEENEKTSINGMNMPISQCNSIPYTYITQSQAEMLAEQVKYEGTKSSILFGVQFDIVCVFIENYDLNNTATVKSEWLTKYNYSKLWGNVQKSVFTMDNGFARCNSYGSTYWWKAPRQIENDKVITTTGSSEQNKSLNIYDLCGNLNEWTLEKGVRSGYEVKYPAVLRGGNFYYVDPAVQRDVCGTQMYYDLNGLRTTSRIELFID